jgi:hypothetical protein
MSEADDVDLSTVEHVAEFADAHLHENLSITSLADVAGLSVPFRAPSICKSAKCLIEEADESSSEPNRYARRKHLPVLLIDRASPAN